MWVSWIAVLLLLDWQDIHAFAQSNKQAIGNVNRRRIRQGNNAQEATTERQNLSQAAINARVQELLDLLEPTTTPVPISEPPATELAVADFPVEPLFRSQAQALPNREVNGTNLPVEPVSARELQTVLAEATQHHQAAELRVQGLDIQSLEAAIRGAGLHHQPGAVRITGTVNLIATPVGPPHPPHPPPRPHPRPFQTHFSSQGPAVPPFSQQQPQFPQQFPIQPQGFQPQRPNPFSPQFLNQQFPARPPAYDAPQQVYDQSLDPRQNQVDNTNYGRPEKYAYQRADNGDNVYPPDGKGVLYRPPGTKPHAGPKWIWT